MWRRTNTKYGAKKTIYNGQTYDSKGEANYAMGLDLEVRAGKYTKVERQIRIPLMVNNSLICRIVFDFRVTLNNGQVEYHEYKGFETPVYKLKIKLFKSLYPDVVVRIIK